MNFYESLAHPAMLALARAGNRGCRIDTTLRDTLRAAADEAALETSEKLKALLGRPINPDSPKQVHTLLYEELRLPEQHKAQKGGQRGAVTADEEAIKNLRRIAPQCSDVLNLLIAYRGHTKRRAALSVPLEKRSDGDYFLTSYNACGTATGRISSSTHVSGYGGNLQNQERGPTRRIFIARPGMTFVKVDGSQAEARVVAALCRDEAWLEKFRTPGYDVHVENASFVYATTEDIIREEHRIKDEVTRVKWFAAHPGCQIGTPPYVDSMRQRGKPVTHGANYMGGPHVAVKMADISYSEAKIGLQRYLAHRPALQRWWSEVETTLQTTKVMRTTWGRFRMFFGRPGDKATLRAAVAHEPQSTVGDLINNAFAHLDRELRALGGWPLLQCHDEIVAEVPPSSVARTAELLRHYTELPLVFRGVTEPLVIPASLGHGDNWYDMKGI